MQKIKILFEGHDLKFLSHVIDHYKSNHQYHVDVFTYEGHVIKDLREINRILPTLDIIFCEWGLGNLQWFSHNKLPGQKIVTRIHLQEFMTPFLADTNWDNVDSIIVVGPYMKERFDSLFPGISDKCRVIPNMIDTGSFDLPKTADARFNLGLLGILPMRKSPHLGLEILSLLRKDDSRYKLIIKGRKPEEVDWLWKREEEQTYYKKFHESIVKMGLKDAVVLEPHGHDVPDFFNHVGFVLSPSEFESFHMAIAEGMASRTIPVIRNWDGASALFPGKYIFSNVTEAADLIRKYAGQKDFETEGALAREFCTGHFDLKIILAEYDKLLLPEFDLVRMRSEYMQVSEVSRQATSDLAGCAMEKEKATAELESLILQQKTMVENNRNLTGELSQIQVAIAQKQETNRLQQDIISQQVETNKRLAEHQQAHQLALQLELASFRELLQAKMADMQVLTGKLQEQSRENASLREQLTGQQKENKRLEEVLTMELEHTLETVEREKVLWQHTFQTEKNLILANAETEKNHILANAEREKNLFTANAEREKQLLREHGAATLKMAGDLHQAEVNGFMNEIRTLKNEIARINQAMETETLKLRTEIIRLKNQNNLLEARLSDTFNSLSWKVGTALVKKPASLLGIFKRKSSPAE